MGALDARRGSHAEGAPNRSTTTSLTGRTRLLDADTVIRRWHDSRRAQPARRTQHPTSGRRRGRYSGSHPLASVVESPQSVQDRETPRTSDRVGTSGLVLAGRPAVGGRAPEVTS